MNPINRVIWIVLDGVGSGHAKDASQFGDDGSNTISNLSKAAKKVIGRPLNVPHLKKCGLGNITQIEGEFVSPSTHAAFGKASEKSAGKDTTSGHWEMSGLPIFKPFKVFENGFPKEIVDQWVRENGLTGVLWNQAASGTEIIKKFGVEHIQTKKPILYTSADSVWQVAAHETHFGLDRLYKICESARKICDELQVGRVIARPFVGETPETFKRTYNRKDYSQLPPSKTVLDYLTDAGVFTLGIGKISNIFADQGIQKNIHTEGNTDGIRVLVEQIKERSFEGLIYCNLIDFDMVYGHRRDVPGFAKALEEYDVALETMIDSLDKSDLLIMTADHGNDPTHEGTDHTRETVPVLCYSPSIEGPIDLNIRDCFGDMGFTIAEALLPPEKFEALKKDTHLLGTSFLGELGFK